jgi:hypothetical protein
MKVAFYPIETIESHIHAMALTSHTPFSTMRTDFADRRGFPGKCRSGAIESNSYPRDGLEEEENRQQQRLAPLRR